MSEIFTGTIIVSEPQLGIAVVQSTHGISNAKTTRIGLLPCTDSECGVVVNQLFTAGTTVSCISHISNDLAMTYILGPINEANGDTDDFTKWRCLYYIDGYKQQDSTATYTIMSNYIKGKNALPSLDFAHSIDSDALPGDFDARDKYGANGIHIGRLISQLHGSSVAYINVDSLYNTSKRVADRIEDHTLLSMCINSSEYRISNIAVNETEAFGLKSKPPFMQDGSDDIKLTDETAIPFYRMTSIAGAGADGVESCIIDFPQDIEAHTADTEPQIMAKQRVSISGAITEASAASLVSIKSPFITGLLQLGYGCKSKKQKQGQFDDILEPYTSDTQYDSHTSDEAVEDMISDADVEKIINKILSSDYVEKLRERMCGNGLFASRQSATFGKTRFTEQQLTPVGGPTTDQQYGLPAAVKLTDPVTGREQTYYASTSFISQEEDGSILIADGYGSEIRMSRGNIYISPALDLFLRPGRDLSAMVPRHQSYNSQGSCTINSDDSVYMHGTTDVKIAGATNGKGVVLLESRSVQQTDGIILKSNSNISVTGSNLYIGRNSHTKNDKGRINEPETPGMIIIDAGSNGKIAERSASHTVDTQRFIATAISGTAPGSTNSALVVSSDICLYTRQVIMPSSLIMRPIQGTQQISLFRNGSTETVNLTTGAENIGLIINGNIVSTGSFHCNGSGVFCSGIAANGVVSNTTMNAVIDRNDTWTFKKQPAKSTDTRQEMNADICRSLKDASSTLYQDYFVVGNAFAFPATYGVSDSLRVPCMLWQAIAAARSATGSTGMYMWRERYIKDINNNETACYPGVAVWKNARVTIKGHGTDALETGYIMNAERTNK